MRINFVLLNNCTCTPLGKWLESLGHTLTNHNFGLVIIATDSAGSLTKSAIQNAEAPVLILDFGPGEGDWERTRQYFRVGRKCGHKVKDVARPARIGSASELQKVIQDLDL